MTLLASALEYESRGWSVIPIQIKGKRPLVQWEQYQTRRAGEDQISEWWRIWPKANIGLVTGEISGLVVVDVDSTQAAEVLKNRFPDINFRSFPIVITGKGWHFYFRHPGVLLGNRTAVLPGVDVRGDGGYVLAAPSLHPSGKIYTLSQSIPAELPLLPSSLYQLIQSPSQDHVRATFNTTEALSGVAEGKRDETIFKLASKLRGAGVPIEWAESLVNEAARNCDPPFSETIALEKVQRVYRRYSETTVAPNGTSHPVEQAEFWPSLVTAKEFLEKPTDPARWIWEDCLPLGSCSLLVAKPKVGKSTLAVALSMAISRGYPLLGRGVQTGQVAYVSLDASWDELRDIFIKFELKDSDNILIHAGRAPVRALHWAVDQIEKYSVKFLVIDTLQKMFRFKNINDYSEVTNAMEPLEEAQKKYNCHIMYSHHAGKFEVDDLDSAIGSTALRGLAYTYFHMKRLDGNSRQRIFRSDQRGGRNFDEIAISDGSDGFIQKTGTIVDAWIADRKLLVKEFLEETPGSREKEILLAVEGRRRITIQTIRLMLKNNEIERTGKGGNRDPFRYYLAGSLIDHFSEIGEQNQVAEKPDESQDSNLLLFEGGNRIK